MSISLWIVLFLYLARTQTKVIKLVGIAFLLGAWGLVGAIMKNGKLDVKHNEHNNKKGGGYMLRRKPIYPRVSK